MHNTYLAFRDTSQPKSRQENSGVYLAPEGLDTRRSFLLQIPFSQYPLPPWGEEMSHGFALSSVAGISGTMASVVRKTWMEAAPLVKV